ncbi:MAG: acyltransferase domain-containing protein, partial [Actinocatenispora sp.]
GEITAAYVAGVFGLRDACRLVAARGGLMQALPAGGVMLAVAVSEEQIQPWLGDGMSLAGVNGPSAVVVSGDKASVERVEQHFRAENVKTSWLRVSHAFHSALMDPMLDEYRRVAESVEFRVPTLAVVSTVTGEPIGASVLDDPGYWVSQVREPVRFGAAVTALRASGVSRFVEVGPDAVLTAMIGACLPDDEVTAVPLLRRDRPQVRQILTGLATAHVSGARPDWSAVFGPDARRVDLPTYAFQRERYWPTVEDAAAHGTEDAVDAGFWDAVSRGDVGSLADSLRVSDESLAELVPALASWRRRQQDDSVLDGWRYRVTWTPADVPAAGLSGRWLVCVPAGDRVGVVEEVLACLAGSGADVVELAVPAGIGRAALARSVRDALPESTQDGTGPAGVLSLVGLGAHTATSAEQETDALAAVVSLVQALGDAEVDAALWWITRGAVSVGRWDAEPDVASAGVWGLGRVAGLELPDRWGGLVDLPVDGIDARVLSRLVATLAGSGSGSG